MRRLLVAFTFLAALTAFGAGDELRLVASVADVHEATAPLPPGVRLVFSAHEPSEFAGLSFEIIVDRGSRKSVRADFPLGSLFELHLPSSKVDAFRKAKRAYESVQKQIDEGVRPEMISQLVIMPQIKLAELIERPRHVER